jgi:hypothetical protein
MRKMTVILAVLTAVTLAGLVAVPATMAGASGPPSALWVSPTGTLQAGPGTNCSLPGYRTVQSAINAGASGVTIHVCAGTYTQQLKIKKSVSLIGKGSPSIVLPGTPANGTSSCDLASNTAVGDHLQSEIDICGHISVSISGLTVVPKWATSTCSDDLYGILVAGGATLTAQSVNVDGGGAYPINGCQGGIGIEVGMSWTAPESVGTATLKGVSVKDYQKNGITIDGKGSSATVSSKSTVTGAGPTTQTGQNGIQVSDGAKGVITSTTITGNECDNSTCGADFDTQTQATGVLFYGAAKGSSVNDSKLTGNDIGAYLYSTAATQPVSAQVTMLDDTFNANRYEQVFLDQGDAAVNNDTIEGASNDGIVIVQYKGQAYAPNSSATTDTITGQKIGVNVNSDRAATGDFRGTFSISDSHYLTGNTKASADNSRNFTISGTGNH